MNHGGAGGSWCHSSAAVAPRGCTFKQISPKDNPTGGTCFNRRTMLVILCYGDTMLCYTMYVSFMNKANKGTNTTMPLVV